MGVELQGLVFLAHVGNYEDRHCIGVFSTPEAARAALWSHPEWLHEAEELAFAYHRRTRQFGPVAPFHDIEAWVVDSPAIRVPEWVF